VRTTAIGEIGQAHALNMGEPVRREFAGQSARRSEVKLPADRDSVLPTPIARLAVARLQQALQQPDGVRVDEWLQALIANDSLADDAKSRALLRQLVPEYQVPGISS